MTNSNSPLTCYTPPKMFYGSFIKSFWPYTRYLGLARAHGFVRSCCQLHALFAHACVFIRRRLLVIIIQQILPTFMLQRQSTNKGICKHKQTHTQYRSIGVNLVPCRGLQMTIIIQNSFHINLYSNFRIFVFFCFFFVFMHFDSLYVCPTLVLFFHVCEFGLIFVWFA